MAERTSAGLSDGRFNRLEELTFSVTDWMAAISLPRLLFAASYIIDWVTRIDQTS